MSIVNQAKAPKIQAAMRRELERLSVEDGQKRGMFFDTAGNLRCASVSATSIHTWIFKTTAGQSFKWNAANATKFSPGEWKVHGLDIYDAAGSPICSVTEHDGALSGIVEPANARLIASAPAMFAALQVCESLLSQAANDDDMRIVARRNCSAAADQARAALNQAEGE